MRIWILNQYAVPGRSSGGTRHAVLAKYLMRQGHTPTVFAAPFRHAGGKAFADDGGVANSVPREEIIEGVRWRFVPVRPYRNGATRLLSMRSYRSNVLRETAGMEPPDVVVGSCVHPYAVDAAIRLARRYCVPFVYEIRDIWPESLVDIGVLSRWSPLYWHFRQLEIRAFAHADGVAGVCPGMREYAKLHGIDSGHFLYAPNGIDPELYADVHPAEKSDRCTFSYLGSQGRVNGLMPLVEAAAILQRETGNAKILIRLIGDGNERPTLMKRANELGLSNIEFIDTVPKSEVVKLCQTSDAFLYCHRFMPVVAKYGVSANKIFDYLAAARPIVFACASRNDPVREANAGVSVSPGDPEMLARAIRQISEMPQERRDELGRNGRDYVLQHHNLKSLADQFADFLQRIVARQQPRRRAA